MEEFQLCNNPTEKDYWEWVMNNKYLYADLLDTGGGNVKLRHRFHFFDGLSLNLMSLGEEHDRKSLQRIKEGFYNNNSDA